MPNLVGGRALINSKLSLLVCLSGMEGYTLEYSATELSVICPHCKQWKLLGKGGIQNFEVHHYLSPICKKKRTALNLDNPSKKLKDRSITGFLCPKPVPLPSLAPPASTIQLAPYTVLVPGHVPKPPYGTQLDSHLLLA
ncbi:hypothetical protein B0H34DRAFT_675210 [Crassisporium funariophilum]|nr:hypothetical protein B0H34DRAFT_675210 [Crassisporium funariophilum]